MVTNPFVQLILTIPPAECGRAGIAPLSAPASAAPASGRVGNERMSEFPGRAECRVHVHRHGNVSQRNKRSPRRDTDSLGSRVRGRPSPREIA